VKCRARRSTGGETERDEPRYNRINCQTIGCAALPELEGRLREKFFALQGSLPGNLNSYDIFMPMDSDTDLQYNR